MIEQPSISGPARPVGCRGSVESDGTPDKNTCVSQLWYEKCCFWDGEACQPRSGHDFWCRNRWGDLVPCKPGIKENWYFIAQEPGSTGHSIYGDDGINFMSLEATTVILQLFARNEEQQWYIEYPEGTSDQSHWNWFSIYKTRLDTRFYVTINTRDTNIVSLLGKVMFNIYRVLLQSH
jgi:hypothetical protein